MAVQKSKNTKRFYKNINKLYYKTIKLNYVSKLINSKDIKLKRLKKLLNYFKKI